MRLKSDGISVGQVEQVCIAGVINHGERLLVVLELERMLSHEKKQLLSGI